MGAKTGNPRGRPRGAKNKRTEEREAAMQEVAEIISASIPDAFAGDSHALLMAVYKDPSQPVERRLDAAKAAIPYEKPRLAAIDHSGTLGLLTHEEALDALK